ncbi:acyltransferase [Enterobacter soli]|nr:acyltransferase [Enterobacter soli]
MTDNQKKIYFIEVLRGVAPLLVVGYHLVGPLLGAYNFWPGMGLDLFRNGNIGVDIFFIISGFIICYATQKSEVNPLLSFVLRRFFRIYPLLIFCILFMWFAYASWKPTSDLIRSLLLLHGDYSLPAPFFGYNMLYPAWTISYEIVFYMLFLLGMAFSHKFRALISSVIILTLMLSIQLIFKGSASISGHFSAYSENMSWMAPILTILGSPMLLEFIFGMFLYKVFTKFGHVKNNTFKYSMIILSVLGIYSLIHIDTKLHGFTDKGLMAAFIFTSMMLAEMSGVRMSFRVTKFFSDISYSLYLTHVIALALVLMALKHIGINDYPKGIVPFVCLMSLCIAVAYITHIAIERPFISIGKRIVSFVKYKESPSMGS